MGTMYILISVSIPIAGLFLMAFIYSARRGQFDDSTTPSLRMLKDDEIKTKTKPSTSTTAL
jgi:cbb3-type cytochrome oxidase maturation protein